MGSLTDFLSWAAARLKEPSTWAGISGMAAAVHLNVDPGLAKEISMAGMGLGGILSFVLKEKTK